MICSRCARTGHVAQKDSTAPDMAAGSNCRRAIGQQSGPFDPPGPKYFQRTIDRCVDLLRRWFRDPKDEAVKAETDAFLFALGREADE